MLRRRKERLEDYVDDILGWDDFQHKPQVKEVTDNLPIATDYQYRPLRVLTGQPLPLLISRTGEIY